MKWIRFFDFVVYLVVLTWIIKLSALFGRIPERIYNLYYDLDMELGGLIEEHPELAETKLYRWLIKNTL